MTFYVCLVAYFAYAIGGTIHFRGDHALAEWESYKTFMYSLAVFFALLPVASGEWLWSLPLLPLALGFAAHNLRTTHQRLVSRQTTTKPPSA